MADYDKENIPESTVKKVNAILQMPTMTPEAIKGASGALAGVFKWSAVMMKYHELLKIVNPRRIKVAEMKAELKIVRE
jgi:dynein heavy chain